MPSLLADVTKIRAMSDNIINRGKTQGSTVAHIRMTAPQVRVSPLRDYVTTIEERAKKPQRRVHDPYCMTYALAPALASPTVQPTYTVTGAFEGTPQSPTRPCRITRVYQNGRPVPVVMGEGGYDWAISNRLH